MPQVVKLNGFRLGRKVTDSDVGNITGYSRNPSKQ